MLNNQNSYRAFSFMETIIGMVISGIVMGLLFLIFSILTERMLDFKIQNQETADLNRFTFSLNKDIFDNKYLAIQDTSLQFTAYSGSKIEYLLRRDYIIRTQQTFKDTFRLQSPVVAMDSLKSATGKNVFCRLRVDATVNQNLLRLNFYKRVYADEQLESTP